VLDSNFIDTLIKVGDKQFSNSTGQIMNPSKWYLNDLYNGYSLALDKWKATFYKQDSIKIIWGDSRLKIHGYDKDWIPITSKYGKYDKNWIVKSESSWLNSKPKN
jgi:hypothetical protein